MNIFGWNIERRSFENPNIPLGSAIRGVIPDGSKGVLVNEKTALSLSVIYSAIRIIAEDMASLPLAVFEKQKGYFKDADHELNYLFQVKPSTFQNAFQWKETSTASVCARGNTLTRIHSTKNGSIKELEYLNDSEWDVVYTEATRRRGYKPSIGTTKSPLTSDEVLHIPFLSMGGEVKSVSPLTWLKNSVGISLNASAYANQTYVSGAFASGFLESDKEFSASTARLIEQGILNNHGGATKGMRLIALEDGLKYKPASISPHDIEFINTQKFQVEELLRPFRLAPHMLGILEKSTNNNIEQQALEHVMYCLRPWAKRWEHELNSKLLTRKEYGQGLRCKYNLRALLRGDVKTQTQYIANMVTHGVMSRNEARDFLGMPPIEGLDEILIPVNLLNPESVDNGVSQN